MSYDLKSAKRDILALFRIARLERPYLMGYYKETELSILHKALLACVETSHQQDVRLHLDTQTIAYLHLFGTKDLVNALAAFLRSDRVKTWQEEKKSDASIVGPLELSYTVERIDPGDPSTHIGDRERISNVKRYDLFIKESRKFFVSVLRSRDAEPTLHFVYVITQQTLSLETLEAPYTKYHESVEDLKKQIERFIDENAALCRTLGEEYLKERKMALFDWLQYQFRTENQLFIFETREASYVLDHLLIDHMDAPHYAFEFLLGKGNWLRRTDHKLVFHVACYRYTQLDESLREFIRQSPGKVANRPIQNEESFDVAIVKDTLDKVISVTFIRKPVPTVASVAERGLLASCKDKVDAVRRVEAAKEKSLVTSSSQVLVPYLDEMRRFFQPEYGEIEIRDDVTEFLLKRMCEIADRETGLEGASRALKGCITHTMTKAKEALESNTGATNDNTNLTLTRAMIQLNEFDRHGDQRPSPVVRDLIRDNENRRVLQHHYELQTDVSTLSVMRGKQPISSSIVPCIVKNCYNTYNTINNNTLVVNNYDTRESKRRIKEYEKIIDRLVETEDMEERRSIRDALASGNPLPKKKRKRAAIEGPSSNKRKRLVTKRGSKTTTEHDDDENVIDVLITNTRNDTPELKSMRECDFCEVSKPLGSFYNTNIVSKNGKRKTYGYVRNVCHTCLNAKHTVSSINS